MTFNLPKPVKHYSWKDKRTPQEIQHDIKRRAQTKEQQRLDHILSSPETFMNRKIKQVG